METFQHSDVPYMRKCYVVLFLWLLDIKDMTDNSVKRISVSNSVSFSLEDVDDMSDDSRSTALTPPSELKQYVGAEGGDDISLSSRVSNGNDSSCESLVDTDEICPR